MSWLIAVSSKSIDSNDLPLYDREIRTILWAMEQRLPLYVLTICVHMLVHIPRTILRFGPMTVWASWALERFHFHLKKTLHSGKNPMVTLTKEYQLAECINRSPHLHTSFADARTRDDVLPPLLSVRREVVLRGKGVAIQLSALDMDNLKMYIRDNCGGMEFDIDDCPNTCLRYDRATLNGVDLRSAEVEAGLKTVRSVVKVACLVDGAADVDGRNNAAQLEETFAKIVFFIDYRLPAGAGNLLLVYCKWMATLSKDKDTSLTRVRMTRSQSFWALDCIFPSTVHVVLLPSNVRGTYIVVELESPNCTRAWAAIRGLVPITD